MQEAERMFGLRVFIESKAKRVFGFFLCCAEFTKHQNTIHELLNCDNNTKRLRPC